MVVHFGDFTVDLGSRQLLRGTEEIHLGPKAFALLEVLLTKRPQALLGRVDEGVGWFESPEVSRRHARILVADGKATLEDLGSKNGTFLRDKRLTAPSNLSDGNEIRLGRVRMTFRVLPPLSTRTGAVG